MKSDESQEIPIDPNPVIESWADIKFKGKPIEMYETEFIIPEGEGDNGYISSSSSSDY